MSPVELTQAILERIEALDGDLKNYGTVMADSALASARTAERDDRRRELLGRFPRGAHRRQGLVFHHLSRRLGRRTGTPGLRTRLWRFSVATKVNCGQLRKSQMSGSMPQEWEISERPVLN